jgi:sugar transferase (PEP-CTERM/EpsH1 system associated)
VTGQNRPRVLFLAHLLPFPPDGGAKIKSYYTLKALSVAYDVTLVSFIRSDEEKEFLDELRPFCVGGIQTIMIERSKTKNITDAAAALVGRQSFIVARDRVPEMQKAVIDRLQNQRYSAVHIDHLQMAQYVLPRRTGAHLLLDHHNVESIIIKRLAETTTNRWHRIYANQEWPKLEKYEVDICKQCDHVFTVTEEDASILRGIDPSLTNISAIPIGVDGEYFTPVERSPGSKTLLSIGTMSWQPNVDAIIWFHDRIYPMIKEKVPDVRLNIVGNNPSEAIRGLTLTDKSVTVSGYVEDVRPSAVDCAAFIVPLLSGSGMRVKILNAMSMALPVVSTRIGAEGIAATDGKDIFIANSPENFSRYCIQLLNEPKLGAAVGSAGHVLVDTRYSWRAINRRLLDTYARVLASPIRKKLVPEKKEKTGKK